ncbi:hypothetical protein [Bradyrhizobium centrolobii]|uniref:hypothetical protein n=1 Tax=Bradyrhizobium centrolobii TaxID=1505087 RepID=UPI0009ED3E0B|nr:hypothetical protein [Bradyrhizobium centrolobii]
MPKRITLAVVVGLAAGLPSVSVAQPVAKPDASAGVADFGVRRHARHHDVVRRYAPYEPHYYARPVYYRPYPYAVPYPFVFGFGPWR